MDNLAHTIFLLTLVIGFFMLLSATSSYPMVVDAQQNIQSDNSSSDNAIDLLNSTTFDWKPVYAKVSQDNNKLDITVDTDSTEKLYNRAYMQTQLNTLTQGREVQVPLILAMDYVAESLEGNATFIIDVLNMNNTSDHFSAYLKPLLNSQEQISIQENFPLEKLANKPIEFRLYVITDEPGSHRLSVNRAEIVPANSTAIVN